MKDCMEKRRMIMSRTPLRITFVGGGTDLPEFYRKYGPGVAIASTISKYIYITVILNKIKKYLTYIKLSSLLS